MKHNKKVCSILVILTFFTGLLSSCGADETVDSNIHIEMKEVEENRLYGYVLTTEHAEIFVEKDYLNKSEMMEIAEKIEKGINDVKDYLGDEYCKFDFSTFEKITYYIKSGEFVSGAGPGVVRLAYVKEKRSPYIHETVHALALLNNTKWLQEGLAEHLEYYLMGYLVGQKGEQDIDKLSKLIASDDSSKHVLSFDNKFAYVASTASIKQKKENKAFYIMSGSLVKYIEHRYGKEKLLRIYYSEDIEDIKNITGKSFDDIKNEWLEYLENV